MNDDKPPPYPGSYWVIPGSLLAGPYPCNGDSAAIDKTLEALLEAGIRSVISLVDEGGADVVEMDNVGETSEPVEAVAPYEDRLEALGEERGEIIEIGRYTIEPGSASADQEMEIILDAIDAEIEGRNSPTLVHCSNGLGSTGMVIGCYLARHGIAMGKDAIKKISELREQAPNVPKKKSPTNIVQERFVTRWKEDS